MVRLVSILVVLLVFNCGLVSSAFGQQSIRLIIMEKGTGVPLSRVEIKIDDGDPQYTRKDGILQLELQPGASKITIYRSSFETMTLNVQELQNESEKKVYLFPATPGDNEVVIRGTKRPEASRKNITIEEAIKVAPGGDPAQIPKLLPGVQSDNFNPAVVVRGSGPEDTKYKIDDFTVPFIFHRISSLSVIPPELLSDVEFSSGGFGAQYGEATGGVIVLRTKTEIPDRPLTKFRVNIPIYSGLYHERPIDDGQAMVAVSGRRSYIEAILPIVLKDQVSDLTVTPYFGDAHAFYFRPRDDGHTKVITMGAYDGLKLVFPGGPAEDSDGRGRFSLRSAFNSLGMEYRSILDNDWSYTWSPQIFNSYDKIDVVGNRVHTGAWVIANRAEAVKKLSRKERIYIGTEIDLIQGRADVLAPKVDQKDPFFDFEEAPKAETKVQQNYVFTAAWASIDQEYGSWVFTPGLRLFHTTAIKKAGADPRINARKRINADNYFKFSSGQFSQTPNFEQTSEDFGNPDLEFIRSYHYIAGVETSWGTRWTTDFQGFYKEIKNQVRSDPETNKNNKGSTLAWGLEAFIRRNLTERLFGWLSYTYSQAKERDSDEETYRRSQFDQTHVLSLVSNYKLTGTWEVGGRYTYHTGDTYTVVDDAVYNTNLDKYQPRTDPDKKINDGRLPNFYETDIYATKDFLFDTWKMALRFGVMGLAHKNQVRGIQYNYDYSEEEYFTSIPAIPYIEVRGEL